MANDSYRHKAATRRNNPTPETESLMTDEDRKPKPFTIDRHEIATPVLAWQREGETSALTGDAPEDALLRMEALPLYVREKIAPSEFVNQLRKPDSGIQLSTDDFNGLPEGADPLNFYEHSGNWQNRLIHGDSADVMKSLIAKDGLAGQVQMIYYDPPYGMSYQSNFQPTTDNLDVKDNDSAVPAGDALPIRAFRDTYRNGVHSYLDGIHKQCVLARELLADGGSLFVQIGDENVHRLGVLLDEVFGADNRVATITWRPTGMPSSKLLGESASYILWYAKDKERIKFNPIYEPRDRQGQMADFTSYAGVSERGEPDRKPSKDEREDVAHLPEGARLFKRSRLTSQGYSTTGRSVDYWYNGKWHSTGPTSQWRVSVHSPLPRDAEPVTDDEPCPGDPDGRQEECGMCSLKRQDRLSDLGKTLHWKLFEEERPGRKVDNVWHSVAAPSKKRYVVQTADSIVERCLLMTTDPGDLVLDPTCGSGVTADLAEEWGRRWITCDAQRVAVAVARSHMLSHVYTWHKIADGGADPSAGFMEESIPWVTAKTLAYRTVGDPENQIRLVDRTDVDKRRPRICSAFTVESISPYTYLPLDEDSHSNMPTADPTDAETLLQLLRNTPVCDADGRPIFDVVETIPWPDTKLVGYGARCASATREGEFTAGVMIAAADASITIEVARRAAVEARDNDPGCENLIIIGYDFEAGIPPAVGPVHAHRVIASRDLRLPETVSKSADGGSFVLLAEPDVILDTSDDGNITVELLGCDTYDPAANRARGYGTDQVECWMLDTNHDGFSFRVRRAYFPNGFRKGSDIKKLIAKIPKRERDEHALDNIQSTVSQPFAPPDPGRNIAIKVITTTGADMTTTIDDGW
ncbi:MAG: site-specific DNA-methyltransferase [Acidimicrobiales bacterium]|nr:site-specific DNA-methyltransferase [Acidimicrobiales bacterium]MYD82192.1 site-specific DNA-methyltransferase [Acidimicrobiales bacterium]MYJ64203.1 site-specific DNA-methyltransferase [Acidimicrobiales bacterium]